MRKIIVGATVVLLGAGAASRVSAQALSLRGSDTLEDVAKNVIADCSIAAVAAVAVPGPPASTGIVAPGITYAGGGSGTGQNAMYAAIPTQHIAPMSRALNGTANGTPVCPVVAPATQGTLNSMGTQLLIGLDGIAVVAANHLGIGGDLSVDTGQCPDSILDGVCSSTIAAATPTRCTSETTATVCPAGDTCVGKPITVNLGATNCTADGCVASTTTPGTFEYTFNTWKEVLAMIYGGQNRAGTVKVCSNDLTLVCTSDAGCVAPGTCGAAPQLTATFPKSRVKARINCASPVRKALADNYGTFFRLAGGCGISGTSCAKLKHAFRRADSSGTSDTFVTLTGMIAIPASSAVVCGTPPVNAIEGVDPASATANPFCNAGLNPMNKGGSDYLDLDPIRRIADAGFAPRPFFEELAEGGLGPVNPPVVADPATGELAEHAGFRGNYGPDLCNPATWLAAEQADLKSRKGLGLVLPIEIPANFTTDNQAYWNEPAATQKPGDPPLPGTPTVLLCDSGQFAPTLISAAIGVPSQGVACPSGIGQGNCLLPVHKNADGTVNFNCLSDLGNVNKAVLNEAYYNTVVVNSAGKLVPDGYCNAGVNIPCARQARPVTAWYRLHVVRATGGALFAAQAAPTIGTAPGTPSAVTVAGQFASNTCRTFDATTQIGCLVKSNPCSIGFAGREAVDKLVNGTPANFAYRLGGDTGVGGVNTPTPPTDNNVKGLLDINATAFYPMSRKLFVNKWVDPARPEASAANASNEDILFQCFSSTVTLDATSPTLPPAQQAYNSSMTDHWISKFNFLPVPGGVKIDNACPNNR